MTHCRERISKEWRSFRGGARLVEVPVVAMDRKAGQPVRNPARVWPALREGKYPVFTNRRRVQEESSPLVAVLADAFNARFEDQHFATKAVTDVIAQTEGPARWGVYSLDGRGLLILHDYSEDSWSHIERLAVRASGGSLGALTPDESEPQPAKGGRNEPAAGEFRVRVATTLSAFRGIGQHLAALPNSTFGTGRWTP